MPTIKSLLERNAKLVLFSHLGKVKTDEDKLTKSLAPVAVRLGELLGKSVKFVAQTRGEELEQAIKAMANGDVLMFENTRFEKGETKDDEELGKYWASLGELFVNDAFGTAHRAHASNVGIARHLPTVSGFLMGKEIENLSSVVDDPQRPFVAILGGAKVSDKIAVIENLLTKADKLLIGGAMAFTFLKAMGQNIGNSLLESDRLELAKELLDKADGKIVLPVDVVAAKEFKEDAEFRTCDIADIKDDEMGLDIGPKSVEIFQKELANAKTVVWNGPMGVFEMPNFAGGTKAVCEYLSKLKLLRL